VLTAERLRELLHYDPETGVFTWLVDRRPTIKAGDVAGCKNGIGYIVIKIDAVLYAAHRLAWLMMEQSWPTRNIDHINGIRNDNRWGNLRDAAQRINIQNRRSANANNKLGVLGVYKSRRGEQFEASIYSGRKIILGLFDTPEEAHQAYLEAKRKLHEGCTI